MSKLAIDEQLRREILRALKREQHSFFTLGAEVGVNPSVLNRFVRGERDLRLATAAKIAKVLKLRLVSS